MLVDESQRALRKLYARWLAETHTVRTASDGREATEQFDAAVDGERLRLDLYRA